MPKLNIKIYRNLMGASDRWAKRTRALRKKHHVIMLNLIGSPFGMINIPEKCTNFRKIGAFVEIS